MTVLSERVAVVESRADALPGRVRRSLSSFTFEPGGHSARKRSEGAHPVLLRPGSNHLGGRVAPATGRFAAAPNAASATCSPSSTTGLSERSGTSPRHPRAQAAAAASVLRLLSLSPTSREPAEAGVSSSSRRRLTYPSARHHLRARRDPHPCHEQSRCDAEAVPVNGRVLGACRAVRDQLPVGLGPLPPPRGGVDVRGRCRLLLVDVGLVGVGASAWRAVGAGQVPACVAGAEAGADLGGGAWAQAARRLLGLSALRRAA